MHGYENTTIGGVEMYLPKSWISAIKRHHQSALGETVVPLSVQFTNADELRKRAEAAEKERDHLRDVVGKGLVKAIKRLKSRAQHLGWKYETEKEAHAATRRERDERLAEIRKSIKSILLAVHRGVYIAKVTQDLEQAIENLEGKPQKGG